MNALDSLLSGRKIKLPSLPVVGLKIIQAIKRDDFSSDELAKIISFDPALASRTLSLANSAYYSPISKVDSIKMAIYVLGSTTLKNIALSFVIVRGLREQGPENFDYDYFWKRAITAAVAAEVVSKRLGKNSGNTFITSLLMDIGIPVMFLCRPDDYMRVLDEKMVTGAEVVDIERAVFGFDHQEVGREILKKWSIPETVYIPVSLHHSTEDVPPEYADTVETLNISNIVSSIYHGGRSVEMLKKLKDLLENRFNFKEGEVDIFIDEVAEKTVEVLTTFEINPGEMKPYSDLLQEANEELSNLNISYEQLLIELRQSKEKSERLAKQLKKIAFRDPLTGFYNRRFFQEIIDKEIGRAERYSHPFSLILLDLDNFKEINDTYGHPKGDMALRLVCGTISESIRESDTAARYGGDELGILLPDTDMEDAMLIAERLRKRVEELEVKLKEGSIKFSISAGVGTYRPEMGRKKRDEIIEEVDRALYDSKKAGRNRISAAAPCSGAGA